MLMADDPRRKRLNGASMVGYCSPEQYRTKRKKFEPPVQSDLIMKSHISVEWDANHQSVVAKREQIGISWRKMRPFVRFNHNGHKVLADVLGLPEEIFGLDSLSEVLSYEVWNTQLLDNERNFLKQFLPSNLEPHQVVQELLSGDNFHFGNPFLKWGASLRSGDLHPDMIVYQERHLKSDKRAYLSQLHNYHKDMIGFLIKQKEKGESCKDPEKELLPNILRSKNDIEKRRLSNLDEFRDDGNVTMTSESSSWGAEEKAYGDNQISSMGQGDELQRRVLGKDLNKIKSRNMMASSDFTLNVGGRLKKGGKLHMENIHASDGEKYMSYIKISKKQHELAKSMMRSCKSIPNKTLNCVLGDLKYLRMQPQPYKLFIKEEQKNLHELWLQLVNKHLPASYANWKQGLVQKRAMINSLLLEMKDRSNILVEDEDVLSIGVQVEDKKDGGVNDQSSLKDEDFIVRVPEDPPLHNSYHSGNDKLHRLHIDLDRDITSKGNDASHDKTGHSRIVKCQDYPVSERAHFSSEEDSIARFQENPSLHTSDHSGDDELPHLHFDMEKRILSKGDDASQNRPEHSRIMNSQVEGGPFPSSEGSVTRFLENPSVNKSYRSGDVELHRLHIDLERNILSKGDDASQNKSEHSRVMNSQDDSIGGGSSDGHAWPAVEMGHSYYDLAVTNNYMADGLSLINSQVNQDKQSQMIGPESNLHRQSDDGPFSSYSSQDQIGLIQSLIKDKGVNSYHQEQKGAGFNFQVSNNVQMEDGQFSSHFKESLQTSLTLDQGLRQAAKMYVPDNISGNIYSDGGRYSIPRQDPLSAGCITDWTVSAPPMVLPSQTHVNTGNFIRQPLFSSDHQVQGAWNGSGNASLSSHSLGTGGNSDQNLFGVLSQCSQLRTGSPYESIRHTDQFLQPRINAVVPPSSHPIDYFSGRDAPGARVSDDMSWINLTSQNPTLNDQMGKTYTRSWNR